MLVANERRTGRVWSPALVDADICAGFGQDRFCKRQPTATLAITSTISDIEPEHLTIGTG